MGYNVHLVLSEAEAAAVVRHLAQTNDALCLYVAALIKTQVEAAQRPMRNASADLLDRFNG